MADFSYQGVDRGGQKVSGMVSAPSESEVRVILRQKGVRPTKISKGSGAYAPPKESKGPTGRPERLSLEQVSLMTRQLQLLISSGVPLIQGLTILQDQVEDKVLLTVLKAIEDSVSKGSFFWEALALFPQTFPKLYVALVRAGESSGSLDQMLKRLGKYLENSERVKRMIKGAMMYPIIVILIGIAVVALMLIFVIPKFEEMLKTGGQELPLPTQIVVNLSHFLRDNILFLIVGLVGVSYAARNYFRTPEGRVLLDRLFLKLPLIGNIILKGSVARFCRTLQTLLMAGVNVVDAVDICRATLDNSVIEQQVSGIRAEIEVGKTLGMVLTRLSFFPRMAVQMITVGEATGNVDKMLEKVADYYEDEVEVLVAGMSKAFEPILLVGLGGTVGGIMIAMYLPIFKLAGGAE